MSTTLLRHTITETPDIASAINCAIDTYPQASRAEVLRLLVLRGAEAARHDLSIRQALVKKWSGFLPGVYPPGAAASLKDEWPD